MSILIQLSAAKMRLSVQTSHLYRTFIQNLYRRVGRPAENVLNMEYLIWRTEILSDEGLKFCENLSANGTRGRNLIIQQYVFQYVQVAVGREWPRLFLFVWRDHIYACSSINIMYALVSTRQKFDV